MKMATMNKILQQEVYTLAVDKKLEMPDDQLAEL
jgi:hypothetical protein